MQWTVVDPYNSRFSLSSCPTNLIGNNNHSNNSNNNQNNDSTQNSDQQQRQQQQQDAVSTQQQQQQHLQQQLQQYQQQQQQQQNSAYSPQIITVSGYTNAAAAAAAVAAGQNLSPPSPSDANMVQSVYSQGPTPSQSPVSNIIVGGSTGSSTSNSAANNAALNIKRKRSVNPQGDENFIRALEAVRSGGIGFCKAARLFGVNNRTLWLEYKKRGYPVSRPSIKARIVKQEPNLSPSPTPPTNATDDTNENYDMAAAVAAAQTAALNMQIPPAAETPTTPSLMCTTHHSGSGSASTASAATHPTMGVMSFLDTRHMDFPASLHTMSRQRYIDANVANSGSSAGTINVNPAAMNLQSINFNSI